MARVSACCRRGIRNFEGLRLRAYRDPGGVLTIGYGHTGPGVFEGQVITQERAEALLRADLAKFERGIENMLTRPANPDQFDSLVSFAYNVGLAAAKRSVVKKFNAGNLSDAAAEFDKWVHDSDGRRLPGLVARRKIEREMFEGR